jgi:3-oxoacyl-[acyl-carrier protein] reductase
MNNNSGAVLVVGASGVIGSAVARQLGASGLPLGLHYCRNERAVEGIKAELADLGSQSSLFQASIDTEESCNRLVDSFAMEFPRLSGLAICAGTVDWREWGKLQTSDWNRMFFQHCIAPFLLARQLLPYLEKQGLGRIVYLSSISPKYGGSSKSLHYAAAKAALETTMLGLAKAVAVQGITINGVRAGFIDTPQQHLGRTAEELAKRVSEIPMRRAGTPEEVAGAFTYLFSDVANFVTGQVLSISGGD